VRDLERSNLLTALKLTNWRVSGANGAAQLLGIKPTTLTDRIKKFGLTRPGSSG
jgi:transcriptional regulator with GAF, ATPase, and Fis domain